MPNQINTTSNLYHPANQIKSIITWAEQQKGSWERFFPLLWSDVKGLNENQYLHDRLKSLLPSEDLVLFDNHELIIQVLEQQPFAWHNQEKYTELYEKTLADLLPYPTASPLMKFLASTRIGIRPAFFENIQNKIEEPELLLELQILCVLRSQKLEDKPRLKKWEQEAQAFIQRYSEQADNDNWLKALYQLPILGLLQYKEKPRDFLNHCLTVSFAVQSIGEFERLNRHLRLYYRNAVLKICKNKAWAALSDFKKHNTSWAADFFAWSFQAPAMQTYAEQLARWENDQVVEQLKKHNPKSTAEKLDDLVKSQKND